MQMNLRKYVVDYLREIADNIEFNNSNLTEEEALDLLSNIAHIEMNKAEAADYLNLSVRTFDRRVATDLIPPGKHKIHHKEKVWYRDELASCK